MMLGGIDERGAATAKSSLIAIGTWRGLSGREIETPDVAGLLEDDRVRADRRELDVVVLEGGELLRFLRREVDREEVHPAVAVGEEVDLVVRAPHRADVLRRDCWSGFRSRRS